ncbi:Dolichyl-diphosphooligosaccharide-protein glycosyltransferase subunit dad1 [Stylosanthes scabra]|uniref:Dolichyl-diphosphooligosaccharide-protein glycosyltransferase subunit dad1 n=1 Tax=Stylosanthes scabra TaxID=79078 RepID=A0ABU6UFY6_9FABA|nr:Dolichyl-diphosphooligosaccharide-protein glycosyltransferase subunit dad1 [Stylosanthes scabra]
MRLFGSISTHHQPNSITPFHSSTITKSNPISFQNNATITTNTTTSSTSLSFKKSKLSWDRLKSGFEQCNSPKLGHKWMQYQGIDHWEGLLDPLDDNLRWEILRYGQFVEAAYQSFDFDPCSPTYATCRFPKSSLLTRCGLKNSGYKITKNLRATCSIRIPRWINKMYQLPHKQSSWIGYVAICQDKEEIVRLGRRDVVIALRGTSTCLEWLENLRATLTTLPNLTSNDNDDEGDSDDNSSRAMVENGFLSLYVSKTTTNPSLQDMIREEIARIIQSYGDEPLSLTITGHSLGAALAILSAYDITTTIKSAPMVTVVSFGGPRVGNDVFRNQLEQSGTRILRIVNSDDVITRVPGFVVKNDDMASSGDVHVARLQSWFHKRVEDMQLVYADVGQELRLSSKESPYLTKGDVATCHDLKTYLRLVNGFVSSSCPYMNEIPEYQPEAWL